ncbi:MAG: UDP-N-acetylmuramate--L-alanine ligase [Armatimonadetes bacterium]|nr:UDP-N-acetylmuramate--L-alanine ligase [Armatimonadota bacterium]NIM24706.1 UDP-N-acetylmuramate--L-alanine ligase [Armatimonadota bacterium]NIM68586.1 UDP-N-acetylmuramate--L-alanine ligase [Armatimonadota bacterium]NIM77103.1 UDP-N-acetylmuramate--L-alanine ligase [Armatimonadota bacterium]NIN06780.1 UDP-N-acetylmuramate--L-alanine ligase [Armatimonadota bacterium]
MKRNAPHASLNNLLNSVPATGRSAHFIGIGGIGMSGLAQVLLARGWQVSGSDLADSAAVAHLRELGAHISIGHDGSNLGEADLVVYTDAVSPDNPELTLARKKEIPLLRRSELLGRLTADMRTIAVSGTHGKTTTTAMLAAILTHAGLSPTMFLGGEYPPLGGNFCAGRGEWAVVEACEAFSSFLDLTPTVAVITNLEAEHLDYHGSEEALRRAFLDFLGRLKPGGTAVICADDPNLTALVREAKIENMVGYALEAEALFGATDMVFYPEGSEFTLLESGRPRARIRLRLPGRYNMLNALAAIAAASVAGIQPGNCAVALEEFPGVKRRFQVVASAKGITIVDDYAHHPTEIEALMSAARENLSGRLLVIFQPHLYTRTQTFMRDFARVLSAADLAWVTDIYPAREAPIPGVEAACIAETARKDFDGNVEYLPFGEIAKKIMPQLREGDIVVTMGAGDVDRIARSLAGPLRDDAS